MNSRNGKRTFTRKAETLIRHMMSGILPGVVAGLLIVGGFSGEALAQAPAPAGVQPSEGSTSHSGQTYAPIGKSGYVVPIPEFKLERIIRERHREPDSSAQKGEESSATPVTPGGQAEQSEETEVQEPQEPARLPFDPARRLSEPTPTPDQPAAKEPSSVPDRPPFLAPPAVPEDVMEAPPPRKEILGKKPAPSIPGLLEAAPTKETLKPMPLKAQEALGAAGPDEKIPLGTRGEPEVIPPVIPEGPPMRAPETVPAQEPAEVYKEAPPTLVAPEPQDVPSPRPWVPAPKEALQSPLDPDVPETAEVKNYLRETAPILEEMSLLMTRAPSMSIGDFDPSEPNAPIFPKDVHLKMDSMKRELQILDSKSFAIIPPKRYERFHALIRNSITQTHQACDAIVNYMAEPSDVNLRAVQEHLYKAKELIQKTRPGHA